MPQNTCLGIHLSDKHLTAVLLQKNRPQDPFQPTFTLQLDTPPDQNLQQSLDQLAQQLPPAKKLPPVALALAGRFYQTQLHHSEFDDPKQINQTLRYDIEEDFSSDADSIAACYQFQPPASDNQTGRNLIVHVADRRQLLDQLNLFEKAHLDALIVQPDLAAWLRFLQHHAALPPDQPVALLAFAIDTLYLAFLDSQHQPLLLRGCFCASPTQLLDMLAFELPRSLAALSDQHQPQQCFYHPGHLDIPQLESFLTQHHLQPQPLAEPDVTKAFAAGAALSRLEGRTDADFRADNLPPRTLIIARQNAFYALAAVASLFLLVLIGILHLHAARYHTIYRHAEDLLTQAWQDVMPDEKLPRSIPSIPKKISDRFHQTLSSDAHLPSAATLPESIEPALTILLQTLDHLPKDFDLRIKSLQLNAGVANLSGNVRSLSDQSVLQNIVTENPNIQKETWSFQQSSSDAAGLRAFNMSLRITPPKNQSPKNQDSD